MELLACFLHQASQSGLLLITHFAIFSPTHAQSSDLSLQSEDWSPPFSPWSAFSPCFLHNLIFHTKLRYVHCRVRTDHSLLLLLSIVQRTSWKSVHWGVRTNCLLYLFLFLLSACFFWVFSPAQICAPRSEDWSLNALNSCKIVY